MSPETKRALLTSIYQLGRANEEIAAAIRDLVTKATILEKGHGPSTS